MNNIINIVINAFKGTPWWVYGILVYLVLTGIQALKTHTTFIHRIFILPIVLIFFGLFNLVLKNPLEIGFWLFALSLGFFIGYALHYRKPVKVDKKKHLITLPGSSLTLILVLLIFAVKCFFGYLYATSTFVQESTLIHTADIIISGIITGIFIGKAGSFIQRIYHS